MTSACYGTMLQGAEHFLHGMRDSSHFLWHDFWVCVKRRLQPVAEFPKIFHVFVRLLVSGAETGSIEE